MTTDPKAHAMPAGDAYAQSLAERHLPTTPADVDPADAELAAAIAKGTAAWAGVPDGWVDELRGGRADDAAERIAARAPLPEPMGPAQKYCPGNAYTADQLRAYGLACVREAMRGGAADARVPIPDKRLPDDGYGDDDAYNRGWNACVSALTAALQEKTS